MAYNLTTYLRVKKQYEERKKQGLCVTASCPNKAEPNKVSCKTCIGKQRARYRRQKKQSMEKFLDSITGVGRMKNKKVKK